ncbi:MAG: molybdopterin-dependent oxidoreductase, partial [Peptococcaceae bacterium]|nr:molybdopterin-dependent oxidoreductase [Peptococcaceae bacterium]
PIQSTETGQTPTPGSGVMLYNFPNYTNADVFLILGANPAEDHPQIMDFINTAVEQKDAKIIVADSSLTKTAKKSNIFTTLKTGTHRPFIYGIIKYALDNDLFIYDQVINYTNASYTVDPKHTTNKDVFFGLAEKDSACTYDTNTWQYKWSGDTVLIDPSLSDPDCVFQLLKKHVSRYDIKTVAEITDTTEDTFRSICELFCSTGKPGRVGNLVYAMEINKHTYDGGQLVQAMATLQLLLGNTGIAGGGVNALNSESDVWGSTDMGLLHGNLPGYLKGVDSGLHPDLKEYLKKETANTGDRSEKPMFFISMLKAWYGDKAKVDNDYCFDYLPKNTGISQSEIDISTVVPDNEVKGLILWGHNPAADELIPQSNHDTLKKLDWMAVIDQFDTKTAAFWKQPDTETESIKTEVFLLPAAFSHEKKGSFSSRSQRIQWSDKAVEAPGEAKNDLWIINALMGKVREKYRHGGIFPEPVLSMIWNYDESGILNEPNIDKVAEEINGYDMNSKKLLESYEDLQDDGSTACGSWIYAGYFSPDPELKVSACKRRNREDRSGSNLFPKWSFTWPANRNDCNF